MRKCILAVIIALLFAGCSSPSLVYPGGRGQIPTSAPMLTDSPGKTGQAASSSVCRVICIKRDSAGTAFLHKSGKLITAAHIVRGFSANDILLVTAKGKKIKVSKVVTDLYLDLALLTPGTKIDGSPFSVSSDAQFKIGSQVATWGYPTGYNSSMPLLGVGYLAGQDVVPALNGKPVKRWVVNAAINLGNSGGPLVHVESGQVIGVVSSKLAPLPKHVEQYLKVLRATETGVGYTKTNPDGSSERVMEAEIVEEILQYLRSQTQLVIGHSVLIGDLRAFLKRNKIDP